MYGEADIVIKVQAPCNGNEGEPDEVKLLRSGSILVGMLAPLSAPENVGPIADAGVTSFAMELIPRISRAQSMDVLSSQSNLTGYKAVIDAAAHINGLFPMMMTAAGTIPPARVMVLGVGVAGLQAIATAQRLGAIVSATDVRAATREQVESLGGSFVMVEDEDMENAETEGGYAKEMSEDFKRRQAVLVHETLKKQDIAITTALIPGRPAPVLITREMVADMKPGSVIVDLAVEAGGNCEASVPGEIVEVDGVTIMGRLNVPSLLAADASLLYARNILNFLKPLVGESGANLDIDWADQIVSETLLTRDGAIVNPRLVEQAGSEELAKQEGS